MDGRRGIAVRAGPLANTGDALVSCLGHSHLASPTVNDWLIEKPAIVASKLAAVAQKAIVASFPDERELINSYRESAFDAYLQSQIAQNLASTSLESLVDNLISFVIIKGPAMAAFYEDRQDRPFTDIDIIVAPGDFRRARELIERTAVGLGEKKQPRQWFDRVCFEGINLHGGGGANIDLHHHAPPWHFGRALSFTRIYRRSVLRELGGLEVHCAGREDSLLISALHVINDLWKKRPTLSPWKDLVVLGSSLADQEIVDLFGESKMTWFGPYLHEEFDRLGIETPFSCFRSVQRRRSPNAYRLGLSGWGGPTKISNHTSSWIFRLPPMNAAAFIGGSLIPSRTYLKSLDSGYFRYWKRTWTTAKRTGKGRGEDEVRIGHREI